MATSYGWTGKILRIDLTTGKITETPTSDYVPDLIGGRGIAAMIYWETVPPECGAFDPENALIFMPGVAAGTLAPTATHMPIAFKSPCTVETECYSWSEPGGHWSAELKFAGYDGLVVTGKSPEPVYLWINDGKAELKSAVRLWGMTLTNMMQEIQYVHGPQARVAGIGPAGENLVRQAPIIIDRQHATGLSGAGAVMGSKNLKAIAVLGTGAVNVAEPQEQIDLWYHYRRLLVRTPAEEAAGEGLPHQTRTLSYYIWHGSHQPYCKDHPPEPPGDVYFENMGEDSPYVTEDVRERIDTAKLKLSRASCYACPVGCGLRYRSEELDIGCGQGQCNDVEAMPQYTWAGTGGTHLAYPYTTGAGGKLWGKPDLWLNNYFDDLGLSKTATVGYHLLWFFELIDEGYITREDLPGLNFDEPWTPEFIKGLGEMVAYRRGIGDQLAEGENRYLKSLVDKYPAVQPIYEGVVYLRPFHLGGLGMVNIPEKHPKAHGWGHTGGTSAISSLMDQTGIRWEPQKTSGGGGKSFSGRVSLLTREEEAEVTKNGNLKYFGFENATDSKTWENKVPVVIKCQDLCMIQGSITYCAWAGAHLFYSNYTPPDYLGDWELPAKEFVAVTGIDMTMEDMIEAGEVMFNLERCIHVREGRRREHDIPLDFLFDPQTAGGALSWTSKEEYNSVLDEYYTARGWDPNTAIPRRSTLERLGLKNIADELESKYGVTVPA